MPARLPPPRIPLSRRAALGAGLLGLGGLALPRAGRPQSAPADRRFLFLYVYGGWDVSYGLCYLGDHPVYDADPGGEPAAVRGVSFCNAAGRPSVRAFFETWADRVALVHGLQIPSVTHDTCSRLLFTGTSAPRDDVPTLLASRAEPQPLLPYALLSGPAYFAEHGKIIARLGSGGLSDLLDGQALARADCPAAPPASDVDVLIDAAVRERAALLSGAAGIGRPQQVYPGYAAVLSQLSLLEQVSGDLVLGGNSFDTALESALSVLEMGVSRVATVMNRPADQSWDSHTHIEAQSTLYERLFGSLCWVADELAARTGPGGGALLDEVTVVVMSEMGRYPLLNPQGGKHHWPYTSALLFGAGVQGGQVIGGYDDQVEGLPVDLKTGESTASGTPLRAAHLAATLLALGDVDPAEQLDGTEPIAALIREG